MERFYDLGTRGQWTVDDVAWHLPLVPTGRLTERRRALWRSVVTQQFQADLIAVQLGAQLVAMTDDHPARLYYTVMTRDEARHVEIWSRIGTSLGGTVERDPYLSEMGEWIIDSEDIELKVFAMQVCFEGMAIEGFREIAAAVPHTTLADVCERLAKDDAIHHGFGLAYARVLLDRASPALIRHVNDIMARFWPLYRAHTMWRPPERRMITGLMAQRDFERLAKRSAFTLKMQAELGLDFPAEP